MPNQALEQTRDSVLRYGEPVGRELLNFFVRQREAQSQSREAPSRFGLPTMRHSEYLMVDNIPALYGTPHGRNGLCVALKSHPLRSNGRQQSVP